MTVTELLGRCSAQELTDWIAYERIEGPLGAHRNDLQAGIIAATIANVNRLKRSKPFKPSDFIIDWDRAPTQTPAAMRNMLVALTHQFGGNVDDDVG